MEKQFINIVVIIFLVLGILDLGRSLLLKNSVEYIDAKVISIWLPNPETAKKGNSKWAKFAYYINGKKYISSNRIQVSMETKVGDIKQIKYNKKNPVEIYGFSLKRAIILLMVALGFFLIGKYKFL